MRQYFRSHVGGYALQRDTKEQFGNDWKRLYQLNVMA
jgi:hypothetical protein